jgi:hypothetical protein
MKKVRHTPLTSAVAGMALVIVAPLAGLTASALAQEKQPSTAVNEPVFAPIARVLLHPRCMNCHPAGDAPLQFDSSTPHRQNITRKIESLGMQCTSCHAETAMPGAHMPPAAAHWRMPKAETPMVFEGKTPTQLCEQLKDKKLNGNRTLEQIRAHLAEDAIVKWGFTPGEGRTVPPLTQAQLLNQVDAWIAKGSTCP